MNPETAEIIARYRRTFPSGAEPSSDDVIHRRLFLPMVDEAVRCLHDKIVEHPWQVDFALTYGIGFPAFCGGLLAWAAQTMGGEQIREKLESLTKSYGKRFEPSPELSNRSWCV